MLKNIQSPARLVSTNNITVTKMPKTGFGRGNGAWINNMSGHGGKPKERSKRDQDAEASNDSPQSRIYVGPNIMNSEFAE